MKVKSFFFLQSVLLHAITCGGLMCSMERRESNGGREGGVGGEMEEPALNKTVLPSSSSSAEV